MYGKEHSRWILQSRFDNDDEFYVILTLFLTLTFLKIKIFTLSLVYEHSSKLIRPNEKTH